MSYLADVKKALRATYDEAFGYLWEDIEKALKQSYRNGYDEGVKAEKEGKAESPAKTESGRRWKGRSRSEASSREEETRGSGD